MHAKVVFVFSLSRDGRVPRDPGRWRGKASGSKIFFFEKKKQKTFDYLASAFPERVGQTSHGRAPLSVGAKQPLLLRGILRALRVFVVNFLASRLMVARCSGGPSAS
jgi:hypothetical protein